METFLKCSFKATAQALRVVSANTTMARMAYLWAKETSILELSKRAKSSIKKISLAAAFAADSSFDALQLATNVVACHNLWV